MIDDLPPLTRTPSLHTHSAIVRLHATRDGDTLIKLVIKTEAKHLTFSPTATPMCYTVLISTPTVTNAAVRIPAGGYGQLTLYQPTVSGVLQTSIVASTSGRGSGIMNVSPITGSMVDAILDITLTELASGPHS